MIDLKYKCEFDLPFETCANCYQALSNKYERLLEFVKEASRAEIYLNDLCKKKGIAFQNDNISMRATDLLKEIGE